MNVDLPIDLNERRTFLEGELRKVVIELVENNLKKYIISLNDEHKLSIERVSWEFQGEYDDEGGTDYFPSDIEITMKDDRDSEDIVIKEKSKYSDTVYENSLEDVIRDELHEYSDDLYKYDIDEILL